VIRTHTAIWAAGVTASPAAQWLGVEADQAGRVPVSPALQPQGCDNIFVVGDTAACQGPNGRPLPGIAPVAKQQGQHVARGILAVMKGKAPPAFRYRHYGSLATISISPGTTSPLPATRD
jgi:NADH dehydrogenase